MAEKKKVSGGRATLARRGIRSGGGENGYAPTDHFCVIDGPNEGDLSEAEIRKLYKGNPWAQACITAILDLYRAAEPAPEFFWKQCRGGNHTAVRYVDLGEGSDGEIRLPIVDGRHRKDAIVKVNEEREATGEIEPLQLFSLALKVPADPILAKKIILDVKTSSNIRVAMTPRQNAYRAFEHHAAGESDYAIGIKLGFSAALAEQEAIKLLALAMCCAEIQIAVDAGEVPIEAVARWRNAHGELTKSAEEQRAWLAKRTAPKERKVRTTTGRPLTPKKFGKLRAEIPAGPLYELASLIAGTMAIAEVESEDVRAAYFRAFPEAK